MTFSEHQRVSLSEPIRYIGSSWSAHAEWGPPFCFRLVRLGGFPAASWREHREVGGVQAYLAGKAVDLTADDHSAVTRSLYKQFEFRVRPGDFAELANEPKFIS